ncbi:MULTISPECIES: LuxR C-terminal-related transcriptional regulator [unclassified Mycobacterium]|uniref:LuxR C-terminal-related transcriptional regulator n=1 Tax=unclassified Mycobacterium TaxID=2642494 RepID=UPI0007FE4A11|nr:MULTISPECIES: LuxR C-terminal-related transcriptional regulator [unclassified Mycobacterium]OBH03065.1 LuxR family transcriptional regulator [Mycobacterium sp. E2699]OBI49010.1 LuxR family transcriptional regulator [Mycobacterium sp. E787]
MVARDAELRRALAALDDAELHGVALIGDSGVGKSTLAHSLADTLEVRGATVRYVLGTQTGSAVPLGAFYRSLTVVAPREPAAMLAAAQRTLEQEDNLVVVVDDAQLLDPLSSTLVQQLAAGGSARLIVTIRSGEPVPDAVTALLKERLLLSLHIDPFTPEQTAALARAVLGGVVDTELITALHGRSAGSPLLLRSLLGAGRESGVLVRTDAGWQLHGALRADRELHDLLEFRLQTFPPEELEAVEILAAAEVLDWEILRELCDADVVSRLERRGVIRLVADGFTTVARLGHPVFGEVAMQRAGVVRTRQLTTLLAQQLQRQMRKQHQHSGSPDVRTRIRLAQLMTRSDLTPDLDVIVDAAASAMTMSDIDCGEDLARFAFERGGGLPAALVLAEAMGWQGRGAEVEAVLNNVDPEGADERMVVQWGCLRAANLFFSCRQVEPARLALADVRARADSDALRPLVTAMEAAFACFSGDFRTALGLGFEVLESDVPAVMRMWAATWTCWALALTGQFQEVRRVADAGRAGAFDRSGPCRFVMGLAEVVALTAAGDDLAAERVRERYASTTMVWPAADAFLHAMLGWVQLSRGGLTFACAALQDSISAMAQGFPSGWLMLVSAWSAQAEGARGDSAAAAAALHRAEDAHGPYVAVFLPELELARAWERAAAGDTTAARTHALCAAQLARQSGMCAVEMRALHTAVRFDDRSQSQRLAQLAETLNTPLADAIAQHARGLAEHDGDVLDAAGDRFAGLGAMALAADAAAHAAREHARNRQRTKEIRSSSRAHTLAARGEMRTPAVSAAASPLPITAREREIVTLVTAGLSNRQIAEKLFVSVRTVEGHVYRIFGKLGIEDREQLVELIRLSWDEN